MNQTLHPLKNFSDETIKNLASDPRRVGEFLVKLGNFIVDEHDRQFGAPTMRTEIIQNSGFDSNPVHDARNGLVFRGNAQSHTLLYSETVPCENPIFDVEDEKEFGLIFGKYVPARRIKLNPRRLTDAIFLLYHFSISRVKIVVLTDSLQKILPRLFEINSIRVDRDSVNSILTTIRKGIAPSEERAQELFGIVRKVEAANQK
jgi:hypothetical protein